jgi:hypothetical protein
MSNIFNLFSIFINQISIVLALIGLYYVYKIWRIWKEVGIVGIKASAFLDKKFLTNELFGLIIVCVLITIRRIYRYFNLTTDIAETQVMEVIFDIFGLIVIILIVLMIYQWYKLSLIFSFSLKES